MLSMGCCSFSSLKALFSPFSALYAVLNLLVYARCGSVVNVLLVLLPCVALYLPFLGVLLRLWAFARLRSFCAFLGRFGRSVVVNVLVISAAGIGRGSRFAA